MLMKKMIKKTSCPWGASGNPQGKNENEEDKEEENNTDKQSAEPKTIAAVLVENTSASNVNENKVQAVEAKPVPTQSTGAYVPPSLRNKMNNPTAAPSYDIPQNSVNYRRPHKSQPNFNDCLEFPSLDAAGTDNNEKVVNTGNNDRFEYAKKSGRIEPKNEKDSQINLQNKFTALSSNQ